MTKTDKIKQLVRNCPKCHKPFDYDHVSDSSGYSSEEAICPDDHKREFLRMDYTDASYNEAIQDVLDLLD